MATWKKVIVSGSEAHLNQVTASNASLPVITGVTTLTAGGDLDIGAHTLTGTRFISDIADGTSPFGATSTTLVDNLNADLLDSQEGSYYTDFTNMTVDSLEIPIAKLAASAITIAGTSTSLGGSISADTIAGQISNDEISGDQINGGTIDGCTITSLSSTTITVGTLSDNTVGAGKILLGPDTSISGSSVSTGSFGHLWVGGGNFTSASLASAVASTGDIEGITTAANSGLAGGATSGTPVLVLDVNNLSAAAIASGDTIPFSDEGTNPAPSRRESIDDIATLFAGTGLSASSAVISLDIDGMTDIGADIASGDLIIVDDGAGGTNRKSTIDRVATKFAGTGLTATSAVIAIDAADTTTTSILNTSLTKIGLASNTDYIAYNASNEVNTHIGDTERLSVTATGVDITGVATVSSHLTVGGNLDVNGSVTTIDSSNTYIADKFMIMASGSTSDTDGGILVQNSPTAGYALGYDQGTDRWALDADLAHNVTALVPDAYVGIVQYDTTDGDSYGDPVYGGSTGHGTIYVDTDDNEIWIYA